LTAQALSEWLVERHLTAVLLYQNGLCSCRAGLGLPVSLDAPRQCKRKRSRHGAGALSPGVVQVAIPAAVAGPGYIEPEAAGERIIAMIAAGRTYISTHPGEGLLVRDTQDSVRTAFDEDF